LTPQAGVVLAIHVGVSVARRFEFLVKGEGEPLRFAPGSPGAGNKADLSTELSRLRIEHVLQFTIFTN